MTTPVKFVRAPAGLDLELLKLSLVTAVPLWIERIRSQQPWIERMDRARILAQEVAEKGDLIMFKSKKKGETAAAFNSLAEGLAILSFAPGGVQIFDLHWESRDENVA